MKRDICVYIYIYISVTCERRDATSIQLSVVVVVCFSN